MPTISINGGASETVTQLVSLTLAHGGSTAIYHAFEMRLKNEVGAFTDWVPFAATYSWTLSSNFGSKTVTVEFRATSNEHNIVVPIGSASASIEYINLLSDGSGSWLILKTPDYDTSTAGVQTSYLRLGAANVPVENALLASHDGVAGSKLRKRGESNGDRAVDYGGWFDYTDGDRVQVTRGNHREAVGGDKYETIEGTYELTINGGTLSTYDADPIYGLHFYKQPGLLTGGKEAYRKREWGHTANDSYFFGDTESFYFGFTFDLKAALAVDIFVGAKVGVEAAVGLEAALGLSLKVGAAINFEKTEGADIQVAHDIEHKARDTVHLRIKTTADAIADELAGARKKLLIGSGLALGGGVVALALAGGLTAVKFSDDADVTTGVNVGVLGGLGAAVFTGLLAASVVTALKAKALRAGPSHSEVKLNANGVKIARNNDLGVMQSRILVGAEAGSAPSIKLENSANSWLKLRSDGAVIVNADSGLFLQTNSGNAFIQIKTDDTIYLKSTANNIAGTLDVDHGTLTVG